MTTPTAAQIGRLPKWAQAERAQLLARIGELEEAYDRVMSGRLGPEGSNTSMLDENREGVLWLPENADVQYRLGYATDSRVYVRADGDRLLLRGGRTLRVIPVYGGQIAVELADQ